ncbi:MAG: glycoside hydrolase family 15 protein [Bdellovibrionales bacterium]|nr:glycoside hydrolase family 15 protein [Bdellovibrionales bacterium]
MSKPLEEYALVGDCQTAALVSRDGSLDWLCLPRFDTDAAFAALVGGADNGLWRLRPTDPLLQVARRYLDGTLVLETTYTTSTGIVRVYDFMPIRTSTPDLVRLVVGVEGMVQLSSYFAPRFDYGALTPWFKKTDTGIAAFGGPDMLRLSGPIEQEVKAEGAAESLFSVRAGERRPFILTWYPSHEPEPLQLDPEAALVATAAWWRAWTSRSTMTTKWPEAVERSLITLKALTFQPSGGIVAAPTTSLPEQLGGARNWDYRYCWMRDATFCLFSLISAGYTDEAEAWRQWLLRAVAGNRGQLQMLYGVCGERRLTELTLPWLDGYEGSRPVRLGNAASKQLQLDVYGELFDSMLQAERSGLSLNSDDWELVMSLMCNLERLWPEPDEGIWEVRGGRQHFTHSKVMAWVGFDRAIRLASRRDEEEAVARWRKAKEKIRREVEDRGFDPEQNSFIQRFDSPHLDASLLLLSSVGFLPAEDPRMRGTVAAIGARLMKGGFIHRYPVESNLDHLEPGEGAFLPCSLWYADALALEGRIEEATEVFERVLDVRNDVGLLSEEYHPEHKRLIGNFPQALSHVALINTARMLSAPDGPAQMRSEHNSADS